MRACMRHRRCGCQRPPSGAQGLEGQIKLYAWASALQTKVETRGTETTIDESFFDILDDLGWAVMGGVEGRYKRGLVMVDFLGMQVAASEDSNVNTFPFPAARRRGRLADRRSVDASTRLTTWMVDTKFGFRALSLPMSKLTGSAEQDDDLRRFDFDLLAGFRVWNVTSKVHVGVDPASLTVGGAPVSLPGILPGWISVTSRCPAHWWEAGVKPWRTPSTGSTRSSDSA